VGQWVRTSRKTLSQHPDPPVREFAPAQLERQTSVDQTGLLGRALSGEDLCYCQIAATATLELPDSRNGRAPAQRTPVKARYHRRSY
jgi:hypothetical protein